MQESMRLPSARNTIQAERVNSWLEISPFEAKSALRSGQSAVFILFKNRWNLKLRNAPLGSSLEQGSVGSLGGLHQRAGVFRRQRRIGSLFMADVSNFCSFATWSRMADSCSR